MKRLFISTLLVITMLSISLTTLAQTSKTVGIILPFSSAFENIAIEQKNAIELAYAEINPDFELVFKDSKSDKAGAIEAYNELLKMKNKPVAVISCASWVAEALHPLTHKDDVFHSVIGSANFERIVPNHTVRFTLDGKKEERQLANYLSQFNNIAIMNMDNGYGNGWAKIIKDNFSEKIVCSQPYNPQKDDFTKELKKIKSKNPDALVLLSAGNAAIISKQAREMDIKVQLVGTRPIQRPELLDYSEYTNGLIYTYPSYDEKHPMIAKYKNKYDTSPTNFGVEAYDALITLNKAMNQTNSSTKELFEWYKGRNYHGALGEIQFDKNGDAIYPYMYKQIIDGEFQPAKFQYSLLLEKSRQEINNVYDKMLWKAKESSEKLSSMDLNSKEAEEIIQNLHKNLPNVYDIAIVNHKGKVIRIVPKENSELIGADLSNQQHIKSLSHNKKPIVSHMIKTKEGFNGFILAYPVFNNQNQMIGSITILTKPNFFGQIIDKKISNFPVEIWMMQRDGTIAYDLNKEEIGKNIFTDQLYEEYPSLKKLGRKMSQFPQGSGHYEFLDNELNKQVQKKIIWSTISLEGTEFRIALTHLK